MYSLTEVTKSELCIVDLISVPFTKFPQALKVLEKYWNLIFVFNGPRKYLN